MTFSEAYEQWRIPLSEALDARYYSIAWLDYMVMSGRANFWSNDKAAIVAEIRYYPTGARDLYSVGAAGDLEEISGVLIPAAIEWGKANGCIAAVIESREGWAKKMKDQFFSVYKTAIRKEI